MSHITSHIYNKKAFQLNDKWPFANQTWNMLENVCHGEDGRGLRGDGPLRVCSKLNKFEKVQGTGRGRGLLWSCPMYRR